MFKHGPMLGKFSCYSSEMFACPVLGRIMQPVDFPACEPGGPPQHLSIIASERQVPLGGWLAAPVPDATP